MLIPLDGTSPEALGLLLGANSPAHIEALSAWQSSVATANGDVEFEYLALGDGQHLRVILSGQLAWEVVNHHTYLAFFCANGDNLGDAVVPMDTISDSSVRQRLETQTEPEVHITHGEDHLRRHLGMAFAAAKSRAEVDAAS